MYIRGIISIQIIICVFSILLLLGCCGRTLAFKEDDTVSLDNVPIGATSLAFVFDITGSMMDDLRQVIEGAAKILTTTLARGEKPLYNYVLVPFHDPDVGPVLSTTDPDKFQNELRELYPQGGGDCPEMSIGAIKRALEECLPHSFIYVFTDARSKDYYLTEEVLALIQNKQSQVVFVMTGDCGDVNHQGYRAYEEIASTSSGQVFLLKKSQVNQVLNFVRVAVQARKVNLMSIDHTEGKTSVFKIPVDPKLQSITVSVSGTKPTIFLKDPKGRQLRKGKRLKELLNLKNVRIYNVEKPESGMWTLKVSSSDQHTIRVTGLSSLGFTAGFSRRPTNKFASTDFRPVKGIPTNLYVNVSNVETGGVKRIELLNLKGGVLETFRAVQQPSNSAIYGTENVDPPSVFFYVKIYGIDDKGYAFQRITPTAISSQVPTIPDVYMPTVTKGFFGKTAVLKCEVISLVPYNVQWLKEGVELGTQSYFSDSSNATYKIPQASPEHEGTYTCKAQNSAGPSSVHTQLDISEPAPQVSTTANVSAIPAKDKILQCLVYSTVPDYNVTWYRADAIVKLMFDPDVTIFRNGTLHIRNVDRDDEGLYICEAINEGGISKDKTYLRVQDAPTSTVIPATKNFVVGQAVDVICVMTGYPVPDLFWLRDGKLILPDHRITIHEGNLTIRNMNKRDEGEYECSVVNPAGEHSSFATLNYIQSPHIVWSSRKILVASGDEAILSCKAEGIPMPKMKWFKGSTELQELSYIQIDENGKLRIFGTQEADAGEYTCIAENEAGEDSETVTLEVGSGPVIVQRPVNLNVHIEKNASMVCLTSGLPTPEITWKREDGKYLDFTKRFKILPSGHLQVINSELDDQGMYTCIAQNQFGSVESSAFLTITGITRPVLGYIRPSVGIPKGKDLELHCKILLGTPKPSIVWMKDGEILESQQKNQSSILTIKNIQTSQKGKYICLATNAGGNATQHYDVDVLVHPEFVIKDTPKNISTVQGSRLVLPCEAKGIPKPDVTWYKNDHLISPTDPHYFLRENGDLDIFNADPEDTGSYNCNAVNSVGQIERHTNVFIKVFPRIEGEAEEQLTVIIENSILLPCDVSGIPTPTVKWQKNFIKLLPHRNGHEITNKGLEIFHAKESDQAIYECMATNVAGNATKIIVLIVQVPPKIDGTGKKKISKLVGESAELRCDATGDPTPTIEWRKDGKILNTLAGDYYTVNKQGTLKIKSGRLIDDGVYTCIATNQAGIATRRYTLEVHEIPTLPLDLPKLYEIIIGNPVIISCPAEGTPEPKIDWQKNGARMVPGVNGVNFLDGSLEFSGVTVTNNGIYKCTASNVAGSTTYQTRLTVLVPPTFQEFPYEGSGEIDLDSPKVIVNESLTLYCPATGDPTPDIEWLKDGKEIQPRELGKRITISANKKSLTIKSATIDDTARFMCVATNIAGELDRTFDVQVQVPPKIGPNSVSKSDLSVILDSYLFIDCPATGIPPPRVTWLKNGEPIDFKSMKHIQMLGGNRRLRISNAKLSDKGRYRCVAENEAGKVNKQFDVNIHVAPEIKDSQDMEEKEVLVKKTAKFNCEASGIPPPKISWYFYDTLIEGNTSRISILKNGRILEVKSVEATNSGRYVCVATNAAGDKEKSMKLEVLVPAKILKEKKFQETKVIANQTVLLHCEVIGIPKVKIEWFKDGKNLTFNTRAIERLSEGRQLRFNKVQVSSSGIYTCIATNKVGTDKMEHKLNIIVPAAIDNTNTDLNPKVKVNQSVLIHCRVIGVPFPSIVWLKDGRLLNEMANRIEYQKNGRQLKVDNAETNDAGLYTCNAINEAGEAEMHFTLQVQVPPEFSDDGSTETPNVIINNNQILTCPAYGIPEPTIKWLRDGQPLNLAYYDNMKLHDDNKNLIIKSAKVSDSATYACVATNVAGKNTRYYDLTVWVPPKIDRQDIAKKYKIIKGHSITLSCPVSGIPPPNISWKKGYDKLNPDARVKIISNGMQIKIQNATESDTDQYTCLAKNAAGRDSEKFDLTVLVPPSIDESNIVYDPKVVQNRTLILECPVSGVPQPKIQWLFESMPFEKLPNGMELKDNSKILRIELAMVQHRGKYTCIAKNEAGELQRNFNLEIYVPPVIKQKGLKKEFTIVENQTVHINCPVDGIPFPSILWLKDRAPLLDFPYEDLKVVNEGQRLKVIQAKVKDSSKYTCQATNIAGQVKETFSLQVQVPPRIRNSQVPVKLEVIEYKPLQLDCVISGVPDPEVTWMKNDQLIDYSDNSHMRSIQDKNRALLQVIRAEAEDTGTYSCQVKNPAGEAMKTFDVTVHVPPVIEDSRSQQFDVLSEKRLSLLCPAKGIPTPTITWYRNDVLIPIFGNPKRRILKQGKELLLAKAHMDDAGQYMCEAVNIAGKTKKTFLVNVFVPPRIENVGSTNIAATLNSHTLLKCDTFGIPTPIIIWEKDGSPFPKVGGHYRMQHSGTLEFMQVQVDDSGEYKCIVKNNAGEAFREYTLNVQIPPQILHEGPLHLHVVENHQIALPCNVSGTPKPKIIWRKKSSILKGGPGYMIHNNGSLVLHNPLSKDSGSYACIAQNNAGSVVNQVHLLVLVPPTLVVKKTEYVAQQDKSVILQCRAEGIPSPVIRWLKNGQNISTDNYKYVFLHQGWLSLPFPRAEDTGTYTCIAENDAGSSRADIQLNVQVPPMIEETTRLTTATVGQKVQIPCSVTGYPTPDIVWKKDGRKIPLKGDKYNYENGLLNIYDIVAKDTGSYICIASNTAGEDSQEVLLRIQVPPTFTNLPRNKEVLVSSRFVLKCAAEGIPVPSISWRRNRMVLTAPPSVNGRSNLIIKNAGREDGGQYTCIAKNPAGERESHSTVVVKVPPQVLVPPGSRAITVAEKVILSCSVGGDPAPQILWIKNNHPVEFNDRIQQLDNGSLVIYDSTSSDAGEYKCVATNDAGSSEGIAMLTVRMPPTFDIQPKNTRVDEGNMVTFDCVAEGEPTPEITWMKGFTPIPSKGRFAQLPNDSLRIVATQLSDSGLYRCFASNFLGESYVEANLTVVVHGSWSDWSPWDSCSTSCGQGVKYRRRTCNNPVPANGGNPCVGEFKESVACSNPLECPVDGRWGPWLSWEECSQTCGAGERVRYRQCNNPPAQFGGLPCEGETAQKEECNKRECPVDGGWSKWSKWLPCSKSCGSGQKLRYRQCDEPKPIHGGKDCIGSSTDSEVCIVNKCAVDGAWGSWLPWSRCSQSCGGGKRQRKRKCDSPEPQHGGAYCAGRRVITDYCNNELCPRHGSWSPWGPWGICSLTCGEGQRKRFRTCSSPSPKNGGRACSGSGEITEPCNSQDCPLDGKWSEWANWSSCTKTCGGGTRERKRDCEQPKFGGLSCRGNKKQTQKCNMKTCLKNVLRAMGNLIGYVNNQDIPKSLLLAEVTPGLQKTSITGYVKNIPKKIAPYMRNLISLLSPVYWTTAKEKHGAYNGFTLTKGKFTRHIQVEFLTGEILKMIHYAKGVDDDGNLQLDIILRGNVPEFEKNGKVVMEPYKENYIQTGPGSLYAFSSRRFSMNGRMVPYAWNHTITYEEDLGKMPYLVQTLQTSSIKSKIMEHGKTVKYQLHAKIRPGHPSHKCPRGFFLEEEGPYCKDDDECKQENICSHFCHNSPGSYSCSCPHGFLLHSDGSTCIDADECSQMGSCSEHEDCINTIGSYKCLQPCHFGYKRENDEPECKDIDECKIPSMNVCNQQCVNLEGSFRCNCYPGFRYNGSQCTDINECSEISPCDQGCENTNGSYRCNCQQGYRLGLGGACIDVDECAELTHDCTNEEQCENTVGGHECISSCRPGYRLGYGDVCIDIDECDLNKHKCHSSQECFNTDGSYDCRCKQGYTSAGVGYQCQDIDECKNKPNICLHRCINTIGDYECVCPPGQKRLPDLKSCVGLIHIEDSMNDNPLWDDGGKQAHPIFGTQRNLLSYESRTPPDHLPLNFKGSNDPCPPGFQFDPQHPSHCKDINECERRSHCQHNCTNLDGSFVCSCPRGYQLKPDQRTCQDIDECHERDIDCGPDQMCFNTRGSFYCVDIPCPQNYKRDKDTNYCILECDPALPGCPSSGTDIIEFRILALPSGVRPHQDLIRLMVYNQNKEHLKNSQFQILENDARGTFHIRLENGKGVLSTRKSLRGRQIYKVKVRAKSYDRSRLLKYQTTFIVYISMSRYPY